MRSGTAEPAGLTSGGVQAVKQYDDEIKKLENNEQILFRYSSSRCEVSEEYNPNGSSNNIAGIINKKKNILGMMPHPERCTDPKLGNDDGAEIFKSLINSL